MYNYLLVFRSILEGTDYRTIVAADSPVLAEKSARAKLPTGLRCVRVQRR